MKNIINIINEEITNVFDEAWYHGGSVKSTVRMVFDPSRIKII